MQPPRSRSRTTPAGRSPTRRCSRHWLWPRAAFRRNVGAAAAALPEFEALRDQAKAIKDHTLAHLDLYLEAFEQRVIEQGGKVHWARDAAEARAVVLRLCKAAGARSVTKSKSMVAEEIGLNEALEANGIAPVETDLGEYIVQLAGETPSHILAPAIHMTKERIAGLFAEHHGTPPAEEPEALLAEARRELRQRYFEAEVGITGANFLIAETGSVVLVTNEGNAELTQGLPKLHIVIASLEKVVPTLEDACTLLRVLARSATGQEFSAYTTVLTGPKRPADLDGPTSFHVVLVDNGRSAMIGSEFQDILRCIRCGACMNHCPVYLTDRRPRLWLGLPGPDGRGADPQLHRHRAGAVTCRARRPSAAAASRSARCASRCRRMMRHWRERQFAKGLSPPVGALRHPAMGLRRQAAGALSRRRAPGGRDCSACSAARSGRFRTSAAGRRLDRLARPAGAAGGRPSRRCGAPRGNSAR